MVWAWILLEHIVKNFDPLKTRFPQQNDWSVQENTHFLFKLRADDLGAINHSQEPLLLPTRRWEYRRNSSWSSNLESNTESDIKWALQAEGWYRKTVLQDLVLQRSPNERDERVAERLHAFLGLCSPPWSLQRDRNLVRYLFWSNARRARQLQ